MSFGHRHIVGDTQHFTGRFVIIEPSALAFCIELHARRPGLEILHHVVGGVNQAIRAAEYAGLCAFGQSFVPLVFPTGVQDNVIVDVILRRHTGTLSELQQRYRLRIGHKDIVVFKSKYQIHFAGLIGDTRQGKDGFYIGQIIKGVIDDDSLDDALGEAEHLLFTVGIVNRTVRYLEVIDVSSGAGRPVRPTAELQYVTVAESQSVDISGSSTARHNFTGSRTAAGKRKVLYS